MGFCILMVFVFSCPIVHVFGSGGNVWTYRGSLGPSHWHMDYRHCGGVKQSPIDIATNDVIIDTSHLKPFVFTGYDSQNGNMSMVNNGHTVQVDLNTDAARISGGGLPGTFIAEQFHFHWGAVDARGSEHSLNGKHFPMEMHVVHYNQKYGNLSNAMDKEDGLAALGFFFQVGRFNDHFEEIIRHFHQIAHASERVSLFAIPLKMLIPASLSTYYRYEGSLTTPPCYETVIWTLFHEKIEIAEEQLQDFREKLFENRANVGIDIDISDDYRPLQCLNARRVYASHESLKYHALDQDGINGVEGIKVSAIIMMTVLFYFISNNFVCDIC